MGSSESKMAASAATKTEPVMKKTHISHLTDPRSPSEDISRTPIQVGETALKVSGDAKRECPLVLKDPRSPSVGITRTPIREVMRVTVGSLARRLGNLFHNESEGKAPERPQKTCDAVEEVTESEELASTEPLLGPRRSCNPDSLAEHANLLATPVQPSLEFIGNSSPFVLLGEPQFEVEIETEANVSLEEAEEARETPLNKRLSMSLITCHDGAISSCIFADVHKDDANQLPSNRKVESIQNGVDHSYSLPSITVQPACSQTSGGEKLTVQEIPTKQKHSPEKAESSLPPSEQPKVKTEQLNPLEGVRCLSIETKSPSQLEFKPQWLGRGFSASRLGTKGVQANRSSPLAVREAVKYANNKNAGKAGGLKMKGAEGRSPLQILKETNSPRNQRSRVKPKVSIQDRQRHVQTDRQVLAARLDKENR